MLVGTIGVIGAGLILQQLLSLLPWPLRGLGEACILKMTFSLRGLAHASSEVRQALEAQDLDEARRLLSWHLVSRDTSQLSASQVAAAAVESVAENASDGVVAPLFYYVLGGLPAALAYRFVNTADSMLGYRDPIHFWLGKAAARLDDLVNLLPARLTALCIALAALMLGNDMRQAWRVWRQDAHRTASPNSGHPMSSMAGALRIELAKVGHYHLGAGQPPPVTSDITQAVRLLYAATAVAVLLLILLPCIL
jgi:adenosylcobinamide-phosphate synthase